MDILEQLQDKIQHTIQAIENLQLENMQLQEDLEALRGQLASTEATLAERDQELASLRDQNNQLNQEQTRMSHEHHEFEARVMSLMQTLESVVTPETNAPAQEEVQTNNHEAAQPEEFQPQPEETFVQQDNFVPQNSFV